MAEAGVVCLINGPPAITPESNPRVSFDGGAVGRVAKASTSPPPYISAIALQYSLSTRDRGETYHTEPRKEDLLALGFRNLTFPLDKPLDIR
jgi:hypothetical protein